MVHAFLDGRDTDPKSGAGFLSELQEHMNLTTGTIATVTGRYYAMDRDKRWERIKVAYDAIVAGQGLVTDNLVESVRLNYMNGITDEFITPLVNSTSKNNFVQPGDGVICFNFRTDRCREITEVLTQFDIPEHGMQALELAYFTMTEYDQSYKRVVPFFVKDNLNNTLGEVLAAHNRTQLRIAETEKYPHVSFFFSGGREIPFTGEKRLMVPSPKVSTYDLQPEMSAFELTENVIGEMKNDFNFVCLNFANADMVGHTGVWHAVIKAVETVDICVQRVVLSALANGYTVFLTADHGNADYEINADGSPNTAHTLNPVPFFIISKDFNGDVRSGKLGDIAPTILTMMNIPVPVEMTGNILI
jgi:2,3-bisphosphoglycerate-independent phosphoglycerate mutase